MDYSLGEESSESSLMIERATCGRSVNILDLTCRKRLSTVISRFASRSKINMAAKLADENLNNF